MKRLMAALLAATVAVPAFAGPASERVFTRAALNGIAVEQQAIYTHVRKGEAGEQLRLIENGEVRILVRSDKDGKREAVVKMGEAGQLKPVSTWPTSNGNPLVPIFLESALRAMSRVTGGSAHYIRNRIKDALGNAGTIQDVSVELDGKTIAAQEIVFEPFLGDKNRDRMGGFADMKLIFLVSEQVPGDVIHFRADTGTDTYFEEISFVRISEEN